MTSKSIDDIISSYQQDQNDFGFTTTITDEKQLTIDDYKSRIQKIEELIMPLLANLHGSAKDDYIFWPNRKDTLEKKIKEFLALTRD